MNTEGPVLEGISMKFRGAWVVRAGGGSSGGPHRQTRLAHKLSKSSEAASRLNPTKTYFYTYLSAHSKSLQHRQHRTFVQQSAVPTAFGGSMLNRTCLVTVKRHTPKKHAQQHFGDIVIWCICDAYHARIPEAFVMPHYL